MQNQEQTRIAPAMKIYIAGPMKGWPDWNYPAFNAAEARLRAAGASVVNPAALGEKYGSPAEIDADPQKMDALVLEELQALGTCEAIYLLPSWQWSRGARKELQLALARGLSIIVAPIEGGAR